LGRKWWYKTEWLLFFFPPEKEQSLEAIKKLVVNSLKNFPATTHPDIPTIVLRVFPG
jgi:hypothetical protein